MALEPRKHHYIPKFYLKQWADENGRMWRYDRPRSSVVHKHVFASEVGFVKDLYAIPGVPSDYAQIIESIWFSQIDHKGSIALAKLLSTPEGGWHSENRSDWSRFLISIMHRTPENLSDFKGTARIVWDEIVPKIQTRYVELRKENVPSTFEEFARNRDPLIVEKHAILAIQKAIDNPNIGNFINNMHWRVFDILDCQFSLLVSDALIVMSNGLANPGGHIAIPLSPRKLFIATSEKSYLAKFERLPSRKLVSKMNKLLVGRAKRFVVVNNRNQERFIEKWFNTDNTPSFMNAVFSKSHADMEASILRSQ